MIIDIWWLLVTINRRDTLQYHTSPGAPPATDTLSYLGTCLAPKEGIAWMWSMRSEVCQSVLSFDTGTWRIRDSRTGVNPRQGRRNSRPVDFVAVVRILQHVGHQLHRRSLPDIEAFDSKILDFESLSCDIMWCDIISCYVMTKRHTTLTISVIDSRRASALVKVISSGLKRWSLHMLSSMLMSHFEASVAMAYEAIRASLKVVPGRRL